MINVKRRKKLRRIILSIFLSWFLLFNTKIPIALAEEIPVENEAQETTGEQVITSTPESSTLPDLSGSPEPTIPSEVVNTNTPSPEPTVSPDDTIVSNIAPQPLTEIKESEIATDSSNSSPCEGVCDTKNESNVNSEQDSNVNNSATSESNSGGNTIEEKGSLDTSASAAISNATVVTNINEVNSNFILLVNNLGYSVEGNLDFASLLDKLMVGEVNNDLTVNSDQKADIANTSVANSTTGENTVLGKGSNLTTSDAVSGANATTIANVNLVNSNAFFSVLNIAGDMKGDIIFPNWEVLDPGVLNVGNLSINSSQLSNIYASSSTNANTGGNIYTGQELITGTAYAKSNNRSYANLVNIGGNWGILLFNVLGDWNGTMNNLYGVGTVTNAQDEVLVEANPSGINTGTNGGDLNVNSKQELNLNAKVIASANSGDNIVNGNIRTGNASSFANNSTFANYLGVGGSLFYSVVNINGNWKGNFVMGYPDLAVAITDKEDVLKPGSEVGYDVAIKNVGSSKAINVVVDVELDSKVKSEDPIHFALPVLNPGEETMFHIKGKINSNSDGEVVTTAKVTNYYSDLDNANNSSIDTTKIISNSPETSSISTDNSPKNTTKVNFDLSIINNVNNYVYPGDTVLSTIVIKNTSSITAKNVYVGGLMENNNPTDKVNLSWYLGDVKPGETVKIDFGLTLSKKALGGKYTISVKAEGINEIDEKTITPLISTFFNVASKVSNFVTSDIKADSGTGDVLGSFTDQPSNSPSLRSKREYLPYIFVMSLISSLFLTYIKRNKKEIES